MKTAFHELGCGLLIVLTVVAAAWAWALYSTGAGMGY